MKKLLILVSCFVVVLILNKVSHAQELTVEKVVAAESSEVPVEVPSSPQALPFGYPPYPAVGANPAYGIPYSYPRVPRRAAGRFASPARYQPYPLPTPGAVPAAVPPVANPAPPTYRGTLPPLYGTLGAVPPTAGQPANPTVFYRPSPVKNFASLIFAPRPYIGYDPYVGYPPFPGYQPPQ